MRLILLYIYESRRKVYAASIIIEIQIDGCESRGSKVYVTMVVVVTNGQGRRLSAYLLLTS